MDLELTVCISSFSSLTVSFETINLPFFLFYLDEERISETLLNSKFASTCYSETRNESISSSSLLTSSFDLPIELMSRSRSSSLLSSENESLYWSEASSSSSSSS
jgi:hypothetical protein